MWKVSPKTTTSTPGFSPWLLELKIKPRSTNCKPLVRGTLKAEPLRAYAIWGGLEPIRSPTPSKQELALATTQENGSGQASSSGPEGLDQVRQIALDAVTIRNLKRS